MCAVVSSVRPRCKDNNGRHINKAGHTELGDDERRLPSLSWLRFTLLHHRLLIHKLNMELP